MRSASLLQLCLGGLRLQQGLCCLVCVAHYWNDVVIKGSGAHWLQGRAVSTPWVNDCHPPTTSIALKGNNPLPSLFCHSRVNTDSREQEALWKRWFCYITSHLRDTDPSALFWGFFYREFLSWIMRSLKFFQDTSTTALQMYLSSLSVRYSF